MLILASASPRRAELLRAAGFAFETLSTNVDESVLAGESPEAHVRRLAQSKARAAAAQHPTRTVLAADTIVVVDTQILGKPTSAADATAMLRLLSGREHDVLTAVAVMSPADSTNGDGRSVVEVERTRVWFLPLSEEEIRWYVASSEPMDKAGAYAIQGLASRFVERINGSYTNVVGLPVALVYRLLTTVS